MNNLRNKTKSIHGYILISIIKQDIRIDVEYSRPNGWNDWAEFFCGHIWVAEGCYKKNRFFLNV